MNKQWEMNPVTRDYQQTKGKPVETSALTNPAYFRLSVRRKKWMYAPDEDYGSDLYTVKKRATSSDPSAIENLAGSALQPLLDDGRARSVSVDATVKTRSGLGLQIDIIDAEGNVDSLGLSQI